MSRHDLEHALRRARVYTGFRHMLERDPSTALADYDLTAAERSALISRDADRLLALSIDSDLAGWWCIIEPELVAGD